MSHDGGKPGVRRPAAHAAAAAIRWSPGARPSPGDGPSLLHGHGREFRTTGQLQRQRGFTWHQGFIADHTRGWFGGMADLVVDTNPASPNYGVLYLAYNWPKDAARGDGLHVVASGDYGHTFAETEVPELAGPTGYGDYWRIGYKLATAPDGSPMSRATSST